VLTADDHRPAPCPYCGQEAALELFEVWSNGEFMLDSCCGGSFDEASERLNDLGEAAPLMRELGIETIGLGRLRRVVGQTGASLVLDWHPAIVPVHSIHRGDGLEALCMPYLGSTTFAHLLIELKAFSTLPNTASPI